MAAQAIEEHSPFVSTKTITVSNVNARILDLRNTFNDSGDGPASIAAQPTFDPSASITNAYGLVTVSKAQPGAGVTITNLYGNLLRIDTGSTAGAVTTASTMGIVAPSLGTLKPATMNGILINNQGSASIVTSIGIDIQAQTGSTTNIGVRIALAGTYSLQLSDTTGVAAGGITFGTDTTLYRSGADTLKTDDKLLVTGELELDGALNHDGTTAGFFSVTPTTQPSAYTQTYATADKTHANLTSADIGAFTGGTVGFLDAAERDNIRTQYNALKADVTDLKQLVNSVIDDLQALGLVA